MFVRQTLWSLVPHKLSTWGHFSHLSVNPPAVLAWAGGDPVTNITVQCETVWGCETCWGRERRREAGQSCLLCLPGLSRHLHVNLWHWTALSWYECLDSPPSCLLYYFVNTINYTSTVYSYRWDVLIEILGAQKQRISRLGVELKHVNGAGNKNKKGETESWITHKPVQRLNQNQNNYIY